MGKFLHSFFSPLGFRRAVPQVWDGFQTNIKLMVIAEVLVLVLALLVTDALAQAGFYSNDFFLYAGYTVAAVFFVLLTIPFARFTDHLIKERERRERAQLV